MLDRDRIRRRAAALAHPLGDLDALFERFAASGLPQDEHAFFDWLHDQSLVDARGRADLEGDDAVEFTSVLPPRLLSAAEAAAATIATDSSEATRAVPAAPGSAPPKRQSATTRYEISGVAGRGGMAVVLVAKDSELMREVAFKALSADPPPHADSIARFLREAQITAQLDHPHVVPVYSLEVSIEGWPAYTMKYIEGRTLGGYLDETRAFVGRGAKVDEAHQLPARLEHFLKVCDAIDYAHSRGVVHRDLKPDNVMIGRHNEIYVMDWGICRLLDEGAPASDPAAAAARAPLPDVRKLLSSLSDASRTIEGGLVGTPRYMAPEQARGEVGRIGPLSDQYTLGLILYEIATLQRAYAGNTPAAVLEAAATATIQPMVGPAGQARLGGELVAIVRRATSLEPAERYASVGGLADDLRRYLRGQAVRARPDNAWQRAVRFVAQHRQLALGAMLLLVALVLASQVYVFGERAAAAERQRVREHQLQLLQGALGGRADLLQRRLLAVQDLTNTFSAVTELALLHGRPDASTFYLVEDFAQRERAPPDLRAAVGFDGLISRGWSVWTLPQGMSRESATPEIERLTGIRGLRERLYAEAESILTGEERLRDDAPPAIYAVVIGLESGIGSRYPGQTGIADEYDPRTRAWYRVGRDGVGATWGTPFLSAVNRTLAIPVSVAIRGADDAVLAVTSVLVSMEYLERVYLDPDGMPGTDEVLLLDAGDNVMLGAGRPIRVSAGITDVPPVKPLDDAAVREALRRHDAGYATSTRGGRERIAAFNRIAPFGWTLVAYANLDAITEPPKKGPE